MTGHGLHPQDAAIIVEALSQWAGDPRKLDTSRQERAWELIEVIAADQGMQPSELILQIDSNWPKTLQN